MASVEWREARKIAREGEISALRCARDGKDGWLRKYTTSCEGKEGPNGGIVSNLGLEIIVSVITYQVLN